MRTVRATSEAPVEAASCRATTPANSWASPSRPRSVRHSHPHLAPPSRCLLHCPQCYLRGIRCVRVVSPGVPAEFEFAIELAGRRVALELKRGVAREREKGEQEFGRARVAREIEEGKFGPEVEGGMDLRQDGDAGRKELSWLARRRYGAVKRVTHRWERGTLAQSQI